MVSAWWVIVAALAGFSAGMLSFALMAMASDDAVEFEHAPNAGGPM